MAYEVADNAKIGRDIVERLVGGIRDRAKIFFQKYLETGDTKYLEDILTTPERRRSRINYAISVFGIDNLRTIIEADGTITMSELNAELQTKIDNRTALKERLDAGETWNDILETINADIINDEGPIVKTKKIFDEFFQYEDNFTTMFGENIKPV